ncbi:hypothetical protein TVAG_083420 [Trichomonas vaginalis G3]|uniref:FHA domain-containing protein n=1 Tax=Trichomonas vaginalis (strain ATCC PRA-98 / G3) TaxID=412133 RepID=A2DM69_TRIV3|nr:microspherule protein 1 family [Trichomonas vaginalis G3]EAY18489.1 hypothetical protein TVAG_083420 [Trichomonas vaginalis G3]KAI5489522.1 microspherule protein 1 family [Trichomonas vaginalis G3]|eukprot:XP_001579475.1 hypothetical protein [Trichomonas vaginalis G3]
MKSSDDQNVVKPDTSRPKSRFSKHDDYLLILSAMSLPFDSIHYTISFERDHSSADLQARYKELMYSLQQDYQDLKDIRTQTPWDIEEDYWLYLLSTSLPDATPDEIIDHCREKISPIRSHEEIIQRINEIRNYSKEEINSLLNLMTQRLITDKMIFETSDTDSNVVLISQFKCMKRSENPIEFNANKTLDNLSKYYPRLTNNLFDENDLAILLSDEVCFKMKKQSIKIGYHSPLSEIDINLELVAKTKCQHITNHQAVIFLHNDFNFYIHNIGANIFRVNGVIIPFNKVAVIVPYSILDFADNLFIFIPNLKLVEKISKVYQEKLDKIKIPDKDPLEIEKEDDNSVIGLILPNSVYISDPNII